MKLKILEDWTKKEKKALIKFLDDCIKDFKENPYWKKEVE